MPFAKTWAAHGQEAKEWSVSASGGVSPWWGWSSRQVNSNLVLEYCPQYSSLSPKSLLNKSQG